MDGRPGLRSGCHRAGPSGHKSGSRRKILDSSFSFVDLWCFYVNDAPPSSTNQCPTLLHCTALHRTAQDVAKIADPARTAVFLCGQKQMVEGVKEKLVGAGVPAEHFFLNF